MAALSSTWRTSTKSGGNGNCVEVRLSDERIEVRDTKNRDGGTLSFTPAEWSAFIAGVKSREFDLTA